MIYYNWLLQRFQILLQMKLFKSTGGNVLSGETGSEIKNKNCSHH